MTQADKERLPLSPLNVRAPIMAFLEDGSPQNDRQTWASLALQAVPEPGRIIPSRFEKSGGSSQARMHAGTAQALHTSEDWNS